MHRIILVTVAVAVIALLVGCTSSPPNTDAWLSYKYSFSCGSYSTDSGGFFHGPCQQTIDNTGSASVYSLGVGIADPSNYTFQNWLADNGFPPDGSTDAHAIYANLADLQVGRDMHCLQNGQKIACYVSNYGQAPMNWEWSEAHNWQIFPNGAWPNITDAVEAPFAHSPFGRVAMVYDPTVNGPNQVSFYAFGDKHTEDDSGAPITTPDMLLYDIALDQEGPKSVPRMCMACHGGNYDENSNTATGAKFLPFDVFAFRYPTDAGYGFDDQQENLRKLNALVFATNPGQPITDLINGMYPSGVNNSGSTAVDGYVPSGWSDSPTLYTGVVRPYCRTCHLAQPEQFTSSGEWAESGAILNTMICQKHDMPHSQVSFGVGSKIGFWNDRVAQQDMGNFFKSLGINSCLPSD
jgi:hypothetical protein